MAREIDRKARKRVAKKQQAPREAWEQGFQECVDFCEKLNLPVRGARAIPVLYSPWFQVLAQYSRHRSGKNVNLTCANVYKDIEKSCFATTRRGSERWLLASSECSGGIVFASDEDLEMLCASEVLVSDATFKTAPRNFSQVFTIHGKVMGEWCVVAVALMENKTEPSYRFVFQSLKKRIDQRS